MSQTAIPPSPLAKRSKPTPPHYSKYFGDTEICFVGDYDPPDNLVGWNGSFIVTRAWVSTDPEMTDVSELFAQVVIDQLEEVGMIGGEQAKVDEKEDAAESKRQREKDDELTGD